MKLNSTPTKSMLPGFSLSESHLMYLSAAGSHLVRLVFIEFGFFLHNKELIFIIRLFAVCYVVFMCGGIQGMCRGRVFCFLCSH